LIKKHYKQTLKHTLQMAKKEKETVLTFEALSNMKKSEFIKLFKKPAPWNKAKAVLFLAKYKFSNGKVALVAVPFKKYTTAFKML
jgi:hypothetical protein